mmetsp:Transcript_13954/g.30518  ORF Transcript_13954/g.30518 Transcript_13954/m.30518 type:complete len:106 (+) Transcript_13954:37-354(+)
MPTCRLQYDLRATHVDNNVPGVSHGQAYGVLIGELRQRKWIHHQRSKWYKTTPTFSLAAAVVDANAAYILVENLCGVPPAPLPPNSIFERVEVQEQNGALNHIVR